MVQVHDVSVINIDNTSHSSVILLFKLFHTTVKIGCDWLQSVMCLLVSQRRILLNNTTVHHSLYNISIIAHHSLYNISTNAHHSVYIISTNAHHSL